MIRRTNGVNTISREYYLTGLDMIFFWTLKSLDILWYIYSLIGFKRNTFPKWFKTFSPLLHKVIKLWNLENAGAPSLIKPVDFCRMITGCQCASTEAQSGSIVTLDSGLTPLLCAWESNGKFKVHCTTELRQQIQVK